ncbi:glycosyltransferase [Desulfobulbus sp.]|uniref:glycosyltransferase n=1 Tax=Desulfobulbus sp. TaxID=895 RepID=UPI00286F0087|nr:glycosyltransferase [Desulfobulbus sp.]
MARPKVSVLLTSYNHAHFLRESIDSVLRQTMTDFELVIADDCSADNSWEVIQSYGDPRIRAVRSPKNRRTAFIFDMIQSLNGEYFALHHSDDIWMPEKLEKQVAFIEDNPQYAAVFTRVEGIDLQGNKIPVPAFDQKNKTKHEWLRFFFFHANALCHPSVLMKADYAKRLYTNYGPTLINDLRNWVCICLRDDIFVLQEKLTQFRWYRTSDSGDTTTAKKQYMAEFSYILECFLGLPSQEDWLRVFPEFEEFMINDWCEPRYAFAHLCLRQEHRPYCVHFGLHLLMDLLNEDETRAALERVYGFTTVQMRSLARRYDVFFNVEKIQKLEQGCAQAQRDLAGLYGSRSWRLTHPLRIAASRLRQGGNLAQTAWRYKRVHGFSALTRKLYATMLERGPVARILAARGGFRTVGNFAPGREAMIIVSHDARLGGATILALRLARFLRQHYDFSLHFLIYQGGPKLGEFHELGTVHLLDMQYACGDSLPGRVERIVARLAQNGVRRVIANTVISGSLTKLLKQHDMTIISLVHEMLRVIEQGNLLTNAEQLATYSDAVIFGGNVVRKAFPFPAKLPGKTVVLGQGARHYSTPYSREETRTKLRTQLGIPQDARIIFGCGQAAPRKGVDLFTDVLTCLGSSMQDIFFVWLGNNADPAYIAGIQQNLQNGPLADRFIFLDKFENDPSMYFCGSDLFFLSSREDPFPTVVLEAMRARLPAAAFSGTGGAEEMLGEGRGIIARHLDVADMAEKLKKFLLHPDPDMVRYAYAYVRDFTCERYVSRILAIFRTVECPNKGLSHNAATPYLIQAPVPAANAKRILHIIGNFHMGGSSKLIADIVEGVGPEFRHHIIAQSNPSPQAYLGVTVEELPLDTPDCVFRDRFDAYMPDCIHVHYWGAGDMPWYSRIFDNLAHVTVPVIQHVNTPVEPYESPVVTKNVFVSRYTEETFGKNDGKNLVIYPGVDFDHYFRHADMSLRDPNCVGMVYRLDGDKITIESFDPLIALAMMRPAVTILVVGGGALYEQIKAKIADAGVAAQFQLVGHVAFEDLPNHYSRMSVFLAPVIAESFGQVTPIAMALQLPVVAHNVGALGEILDTPSSLVPAGHSAQFAKKVCELLDDTPRREKLGKQHQERAIRLFSLPTMVLAYRQLYNELISA